MKILGYDIRSPFFRESVGAVDADTAKGFFQKPNVSVYKPTEIEHYYEAYLNYDLVRGMVDDLAEQVAGMGYYTTVETVTPVFKKSKNKEIVDAFGAKFNLDAVLVNVTKNVLIAGYCPVETKLQTDVEKCALKIVHPKTVKDIKTDPASGDILEITQKAQTPLQKDIIIKGENLAWFTYGKLGNDPRGVSYVRGIINLLNTLNTATANVDKILERYVAPTGIWRAGKDSMEALKKAVTEKEPGEDIFVELKNPNIKIDDIVKFLSIDPRVPFWEYIQYLDRRAFAYSRTYNPWYFKDATEASARVMMEGVERHVNAIRRELKRSVERYWFAPLITLSELEEIPKITFGREPTGVEDIDPSMFLTKGLELGYISPKQFEDLAKKMGFPMLTVEQAEVAADAKPPEEEETEEEKITLKEAMPRHELAVKTGLEFDGTIHGVFSDTSHYYPATKMKKEEKPLE